MFPSRAMLSRACSQNCPSFRSAGLVLLCLALTGLWGCASGGGWFGRGGTPSPVVEEEAAAPSVQAEQPSREELERRLADLVRGEIASTMRNRESDANQVIRRRPYFYREYAVYPDGANHPGITIIEQESRTAPLIADVEVPKQRFSTKMHRRRDAAVADRNFFRDTGAETMTFEYRNNRWVRVGSLFVADRTEELVNGEWVPLRESVERAVSDEDDGWFSRQWNRVRERF